MDCSAVDAPYAVAVKKVQDSALIDREKLELGQKTFKNTDEKYFVVPSIDKTRRGGTPDRGSSVTENSRSGIQLCYEEDAHDVP
jgi:hypothetical protein